MKKVSLIITALIISFISNTSKAQSGTQEKPSICLIAFDFLDYIKDVPDAMPYLYNELQRLNKYSVTDKYDLDYFVKRDTLKISNCYSTQCLTELSAKIQVDYYMTGSISTIGEKILVNFRLFNTSEKSFERTYTKEFLKISGQELLMFRIALNDMYGISNDPLIVDKLTKSEQYDSEINNPYQLSLSANGPRMGGVFVMGQAADILQAPTFEGGFASTNYSFQFGYQFEKQYLNEGNFQALFEFVPMVSGLDQGRFIPSIAILNGIRNNKNGLEFAIGPSFTLTKMAQGIYDANGNWILKSQLPSGSILDNLEKRMDSRGTVELNTSLIIAIGKTFKSGKMNLPINFFYSPGLKSQRFGVSMGWNAKDRFKSK